MDNVITHDFGNKSDVENFIDVIKEENLQDLVAVGLKDGHIHILHADLSNTLETIATLSIATDYVKALVNGAE